MDERDELLRRIEALERLLAERDARIAELEEQLRRRGKIYTPKPNRTRKPKNSPDRRTQEYRAHPGVFRPEPVPDEHTVEHDVHAEHCPHCGGAELTPTGEIEEHLVEDIPTPRVELHCYRRHVYRCARCQQTCTGQGDLELPGAHVGPRARLFVGYARSYLGLSLEKTCTWLRDWCGLSLSRAGALGHLRWGSALCAPVVERLLKLLRQAPVVHADETGWRIDGKNVWAWCFCNPQIAVFLIDAHRSAAVLKQALGETLPGVLVSDFYAAYNQLACRKQRCLAHLLRELHDLREELPAIYVTRHLRPLITLFQDAIALGKQRAQLSARRYARAVADIRRRFRDRLWRQTNHDDCDRIYCRLSKYQDELFTFLDDPRVPADNNPGERDIRSVAAARNDGGVNRTAWGATAFARLKSVIRTCQKNGRSFLDYGLALTRASLIDLPPPLPLSTG